MEPQFLLDVIKTEQKIAIFFQEYLSEIDKMAVRGWATVSADFLKID